MNHDKSRRPENQERTFARHHSLRLQLIEFYDIYAVSVTAAAAARIPVGTEVLAYFSQRHALEPTTPFAQATPTIEDDTHPCRNPPGHGPSARTALFVLA